MSKLAVERMSRVDTAWLRMDTEANLMQIVGVWRLAPPLKLADFRARVAATLLRYTRFRQKVVEDSMGATWVEDENFDLGAHVVREKLTRKSGQSWDQALQARVGELAATPLDRARPLWQMHVIERFGERGQESSLISRFHHCIADGIALISVLLSITDGGALPPALRRKQSAVGAGIKSAGGGPAESDWLADVIVKPLTDLASKAMGVLDQSATKSLQTPSKPTQSLLGSMDMARAGYQALSDVAALALMADDSPTRLKGKAKRGKSVAWCPPLPLDEVKAASKALGCTINDLLLASVAGAIGDYLRDKGDDPAGQEIRVMLPVNLRPLDQAWQLGNRFGLVPLVLPVGVTNPLERVYAVHQRMNELKGSYQPMLAFAILALAGLLVKPAQHALLNLFSQKATAVMTNVPGPSQPLKFCGSTLKQVMAWVPQSGDIGMGVSILSYAGGVQFGLITDTGMCPDPEAIVARFAPEFDKLLWLALMLP
jgi:WS/DGAT/MGAT family acyltransferase